MPRLIIGKHKLSAFLNPNQLFPEINDDLIAVDGVIRHHLRSDVVLIGTISEYIIQAGGKRLRPVLLLLFAKALGYQGSHHHLLAAVIEFIHTATLLHDDVVDESDLRRGRATANADFGNAAAVLVGDFLYSRAFQMMLAPDDMRVMRVLSAATNVIAEGEVLQLMNIHDADVSEDTYLQVIRFKTAKLFEAAAQLGAILAKADQTTIDAAAHYGRSLGTAFQLIDDVLDYSGEALETGKNVGDDLREGKPTLPLIRVMQVGSIADKAKVRAAITNGGTDDFTGIYQAIMRCDAIGYTVDKAKAEVESAKRSIEALPTSQFKTALIVLADLAVSRKS